MSRHTTFKGAIVAAFLTATSGLAQAAISESPDMAACRAEVEQYYGQAIDIKVVNKRRSARGVQVKLAAQLDQYNAEFLICWLSNAGNQGPGTGGNALAARIEPVPEIQ